MAQPQQQLQVSPEVQQKLQSLSSQYQKFQDDISTTVQSRQRLQSQQTENNAVLKELNSLPDDSSSAQVFKQVGPVLLKQEKGEAAMAVQGRLGYIGSEVERIEKRIRELNESSEVVKGEIVKIQTEAQQAQAGG